MAEMVEEAWLKGPADGDFGGGLWEVDLYAKGKGGPGSLYDVDERSGIILLPIMAGRHVRFPDKNQNIR